MSSFNSSLSLSALNNWYKGEATQTCIATIPTETPCETCGGPDVYLGGGYDITCPACDQGVVIVNVSSGFKARVTWITGAGISMFGGYVAGGEMGDVVLQVPTEYRRILDAVRLKKGAFIMVDGVRVRPRDIGQNRADRVTTLVAACDVIRDEQ